MVFWGVLLGVVLVAGALTYAFWRRGFTIQDMVRRPPPEVDLPEFVNILGYLHHELIKHRLPLVRTVSDQPRGSVKPEDVIMLKEAITGTPGRPDLNAELEGYLSGLQRACGRVHLNFRRDPLARRARRACRTIQAVCDGLGERVLPTAWEHRRLRAAERSLDQWFRPRLQALRGSVLSFELTRDMFVDPLERVASELGVGKCDAELPELNESIQVRMLKADFNLVVRNLIRNALQRSAAATSEPKLAVELCCRVELTGEESVLLRVYDTDPTLLDREALYGGQIGRGLNLVTTTLRRYDGTLRCARSKREGFAKFLEVRLARAHPDPEAAALLRKTGVLTEAVPSVVVVLTLLLGGVCGAGMVGYLPDPTQGLLEFRWGGWSGGDEDLARVSEVRGLASSGVERARGHGGEEARHARTGPVVLPAPTDLVVVPAKRCEPPERNVDKRSVELQCTLLDEQRRLAPPVLLLEVERPGVDLSALSVVSQESVVEVSDKGTQAKTLPQEDACLRVLALGPRQRLPDELGAALKNSVPRSSDNSRLVLDYSRCLQTARYPLLTEIRIRHPRYLEQDAPSAEERPLSVNLRLDLRADDARDAYARIHNDERALPDRAQRTALVQAIARHVTRDLEYKHEAGTLPIESHRDLAKAIYFGWVYPSVYNGTFERVERRKAKGQADQKICNLYLDALEGHRRLEEIELDPRQVNVDRFRSRYYLLQGEMWILNDLPRAIQDFDSFQKEMGRQSDFAQGARFYLAVLLGMTEPPGNEGDPDAPRRLERMTDALLDLRREALNPPRKGPEYFYDKVKLVGVRPLLDESYDEGVPVEDALCGFHEAFSRWVPVMSAESRGVLFAHCPGFQASLVPGEPAPPPRPVTPEAQQVTRYLEALSVLLEDDGWSCAPYVKP
jgi:hypothetical protein